MIELEPGYEAWKTRFDAPLGLITMRLKVGNISRHMISSSTKDPPCFGSPATSKGAQDMPFFRGSAPAQRMSQRPKEKRCLRQRLEGWTRHPRMGAAQ